MRSTPKRIFADNKNTSFSAFATARHKRRIDLVTFSLGISACEKAAALQQALLLFRDIGVMRLEPNVVSYGGMLLGRKLLAVMGLGLATTTKSRTQSVLTCMTTGHNKWLFGRVWNGIAVTLCLNYTTTMMPEANKMICKVCEAIKTNQQGNSNIKSRTKKT